MQCYALDSRRNAAPEFDSVRDVKMIDRITVAAGRNAEALVLGSLHFQDVRICDVGCPDRCRVIENGAAQYLVGQ